MVKLMSAREAKAKILLVEDSEDDAFFFQRALRKAAVPYECDQVWDGASATKFLRENGSNRLLVFLDLKIPILNGFEVLKWIQDQPFKSRVEIIILSGSDDPHDIASARNLGVVDYLVKPLDFSELKRKLQDWSARTPPQGAA
jgi:DNA-binding response OmpR family regulator